MLSLFGLGPGKEEASLGLETGFRKDTVGCLVLVPYRRNEDLLFWKMLVGIMASNVLGDWILLRKLGLWGRRIGRAFIRCWEK